MACCLVGAIILTNAGILLIWTLGTNFSEIFIEIFIQENAFENVVRTPTSIPCLNVLTRWTITSEIIHPTVDVHKSDVIMGAIASQNTSLAIVYSTVYSDADQRKHQSSASLAFVRGIHRGPANSPHKWPVTRKMFPFDDVSGILTLWLQQNDIIQCTPRKLTVTSHERLQAQVIDTVTVGSPHKGPVMCIIV